MGRRHIAGYAALSAAGLWEAELVAVVDARREAAEAAADEAAALLGRRPAVHTDVAAVRDEIDAVDLVTDPSSHHLIAVPLLRAGVPVLSEKPLGLTVGACRQMIAAAQEGGVVLATAENYRRGGPNRLARAVLDAGLLGRVHLMVQLLIGGDDRVLITPWRHQKAAGSIALDMGVHLTDLIEFYLGPIATVHGRGLIAEPRRRWQDDVVEATGEDSLIAQLRMESGVEVQLAYLPSGPGERYVQRTIHGSDGSMWIPPDRTNGQVEVRRADGVLRGAELAEAVGLRLDDVTVALLGPDGTGGDAPFAAVDAGYLGVEIADFVSAVRTGHAPEVDGVGGMRAVAAVLAVMESERAGRPVSMEELLDGSVAAYEREIEALAR